jgi:fibronectin type 3 domain-containing protein
MKRMMLLAVALMALGLGYGCLDDIEEVPLELETEGIPAPTGLAAQVGDGLIFLTWRGAAGASSYHLYRRTIEEQGPTRLAETVDTFYLDSTVRNGRAYYYSVSVSRADGIEGDRSEEIEAVPTAYSIIINDDDRE